MTNVMIKLQDINQIKALVQAVATSPYDIDIASGRYLINANLFWEYLVWILKNLWN